MELTRPGAGTFTYAVPTGIPHETNVAVTHRQRRYGPGSLRPGN